MRTVIALALLAFAGSVARADDAKPASDAASTGLAAKTKVPLRIVKVLPDTRQALLFDKIRGTHVLATVGRTIEGFTVDAIDEDEVTLSTSGGIEVVLVVPTTPAVSSQRVREVDAARPQDPYGDADSDTPATSDAARGGERPVDPYAEPAVRVVDAARAVDAAQESTRPSERATVVRVVEAPHAAAPTPPVDATKVPAPAAKPSDAHTPTVASADNSVVIERVELDAALADFAKLASAARGTFAADGLHVESVVEGSLFAKVGVRGGDTIVSVDNRPLRSLDDAATLYARASTARNVTLQLVRGGKPLTLRVTIR